MTHENVVEAYFAAWLAKDASVLPSVFAHDVVYSECYGPEYHGLAQIKSWFADWNRRGTVLRWDIKNTISAANTVCAEWYFRCEYDETGSISSRRLYNLYQEWCGDNALTPLSARSFWTYLCQHASEYRLHYTNTIPIGGGKRARGFQGIRALPGM